MSRLSCFISNLTNIAAFPSRVESGSAYLRKLYEIQFYRGFVSQLIHANLIKLDFVFMA